MNTKGGSVMPTDILGFYKQLQLSARILPVSVGLLAFSLCYGIIQSAPAAKGSSVLPAGKVNITADQQTYSEASKVSKFKGNVKALYGDVLIHATEATMSLNGQGAPNVASFLHRPTAKRRHKKSGREDVLEADKISIQLATNAMKAEGNTLTKMTTAAGETFTIAADQQAYDNASKTMKALGKVEMDYQDTHSSSDKAYMRMAEDGRAERVVLADSVYVVKKNSRISSEKLTFLLQSGNMIAENNVLTDVDLADRLFESGPQEELPKEELPKEELGSADGINVPVMMETEKTASGLGTPSKKLGQSSRIKIESNIQEYDQKANRMIASGNVRIHYEDYRALGSKATFHMSNGSVNRIILTGRPSIAMQGRKVLADRIIITTTPKNFEAFGNVKTQFETKQPAATKPAATAQKTSSQGITGDEQAETPIMPEPVDEVFDEF